MQISPSSDERNYRLTTHSERQCMLSGIMCFIFHLETLAVLDLKSPCRNSKRGSNAPYSACMYMAFIEVSRVTPRCCELLSVLILSFSSPSSFPEMARRWMPRSTQPPSASRRHLSLSRPGPPLLLHRHAPASPLPSRGYAGT